MSFQDVLGISIASCIFIVLVRQWVQRHKPPCPPGPKGIPFLGNLLQLPRKYEWLTYKNLSKTYGLFCSPKLASIISGWFTFTRRRYVLFSHGTANRHPEFMEISSWTPRIAQFNIFWPPKTPDGGRIVCRSHHWSISIQLLKQNLSGWALKPMQCSCKITNTTEKRGGWCMWCALPPKSNTIMQCSNERRALCT